MTEHDGKNFLFSRLKLHLSSVNANSNSEFVKSKCRDWWDKISKYLSLEQSSWESAFKSAEENRRDKVLSCDEFIFYLDNLARKKNQSSIKKEFKPPASKEFREFINEVTWANLKNQNLPEIPGNIIPEYKLFMKAADDNGDIKTLKYWNSLYPDV